MKTEVILIASLALLTSAGVAQTEQTEETAQTDQAEHRVDLASMQKVDSVVISNMSGDLTIEGTDEPDIRIVGDRLHAGEDHGPPPEGFRSLLGGGIDNTGIGVQVSNDGGTINIVGAQGTRDNDLTVFIPRTLPINLAGVLDGDVTVRGMKGEINVNIHEGDLTIEDASGPVVAHSIDGDVAVSFSSYEGDLPSVINSVDGEVSISLPEDAKVSLEIMTVDGDILTDLPVEVTQRNAVMFEGPQHVQANLNGGGTKLTVHSIENDVVIQSKNKEKEKSK
jgi:hypothetical protein